MIPSINPQVLNLKESATLSINMAVKRQRSVKSMFQEAVPNFYHKEFELIFQTSCLLEGAVVVPAHSRVTIWNLKVK